MTRIGEHWLSVSILLFVLNLYMSRKISSKKYAKFKNFFKINYNEESQWIRDNDCVDQWCDNKKEEKKERGLPGRWERVG